MVSLFFSYSHHDEDYRNELEIHLSALKRQDIIQTWHDRRIGAGKDLDKEIDINLTKADIILLLVSPYFIASDYCYNKEMQHSLNLHAENKARVIPVILHPCDWHHTPFGKLRATPTDGKPISKFPNKHDAFLQVTTDIRNVASELEQMESKQLPDDTITTNDDNDVLSDFNISKNKRSSNLRVRKEYKDVDRSRFLSDTFDYCANYFENSLLELQNRSTWIETEFRRIDKNQFTSIIYQDGNVKSQCKIGLVKDSYSVGEIRYSNNLNNISNSWNESIHVEDDGYIMGLKCLGLHQMGNSDENLLTKEGAAEYYWSILISPLQ